MDTLTHAVSGALLARLAFPSRPTPGSPGVRACMAAGFAAAAFPDVDFALRLIDTLTYLNWHQGVTHSLLLTPVWACALALLFSRMSGRRHRWQGFLAPAILGIAIHIAGDLLTAYGTMLFAPFSDRRYSLPLAFVIDLYPSLVLAAGLTGALLLPYSRMPAIIAFVVLGGYLGLQAELRTRAIEVGKTHARSQNLTGTRVYALPQPLTPFNWKIVVSHGETHEEAHVNLWRRHPPAPAQSGMLRKMAAGYQPASAPQWRRHTLFGETPADSRLAREAWNQQAFAGYRRFAKLPALDHVERAQDRVCVWFADLRFTLPSLPPSFRYGLCRDHVVQPWRLERLRGAFWMD
ncbi:MAG: metal-dependent hydrolase [Burkholderiales bacterium]|nr:metal-dependent hydrolase [Burkholderiales bacterium]